MIKTSVMPIIVINLSTENIYLNRGEIFGFLEQSDIEINDITTNTSLETKMIFQDEGNCSDFASETE